ncbi:MAG: hypothetical protein Q8Q41_03730 [bacterium]|nr:hypothetical protein [bacterium]
MTTDKTTKFLERLQALSPDEAYSAHSKEMIMRARQLPRLTFANILARSMESLRLSSALVLTSALILLLLGGLPYLKTTLPLRVAGLDPAVIQAEEREIQVTLNELAYYEDSSRSVRAALNESQRKGPGQLSPTVLEKEAGETEAREPLNESVDAALKALIQ